MSLQLSVTLKEAVNAYTATFFTVVALGIACYYVIFVMFGRSSDHHPQHKSRLSEEDVAQNRQTCMASSSSSSRSTFGKYDVFVSFSGVDTRKTFLGHLLDSLRRNGIHCYYDEETLERGKPIGPELLKGIGESSIAVIIFSNNYASSSWCLDELVEIMKRQKERKLIVCPVFYGVDPSDVRKQRGVFGEGFSRLQGGNVEGWRDALIAAANISGWNMQNIANGSEVESVKSIVKYIQGTLYHKESILEENLVGIIPRVEKLKSLLRMECNDVRVIGIWGMGGAGKTTIATAVFDELSPQFDCTKFVGNVRETTEKSGLHYVQKEMLSSMVENVKIQNVSQGTRMIRKMFCHQKALIVLDDVDQVSQLDALAGDLSWFGEGTRIIVTTRDEGLLHGQKLNVEIFNVDSLFDDEALQLFSLYAFNMSSPVKEYDQHSRLVVHYAAGHPLTLKVLGNSLRGRDITKWITTVDRLKEIPKKEVLETLKVSFDALEDVEKEIFLDISCLFKGWPRESVHKILDCCGFDTEKWVSDLIQRSLIYISNGRLDMHDMIEEMGQHIVRGKNPMEPHKHSRLWRPKEVLDIFTEYKGTENIQAIVVDCLRIPEFVNFAHAVKNMINLRLLYVDTKGTQFLGPERFPSSLQFICWKKYATTSQSANFALPKLVQLEMDDNGIEELWEGEKHLHNLKHISCQESTKLIKTPNFIGVPNLVTLNLSGCISLTEVHESIGTLEKLQFLNLSHCHGLRSFPSHIKMKSLETLDLGFCYSLKNFPEIKGEMDRLTYLDLSSTSIQELPSSIVNLPNLRVLDLQKCANLVSLPLDIDMLQSLNYLDVSNCIKLATIPEDIGKIECLETLFVSSVTQLPSSIAFLRNLKSFHVQEPLTKASHANFPRYPLYHVLPVLSSLTSLKELALCNLQEGMSLPMEIGTLASLEHLSLSNSQFARLPFSISHLFLLKRLHLSSCPMLKALPELPPSIAAIVANNCESLMNITSLLSAMGCLRLVSFLSCWSLGDQPSTTAVLQALVQGNNVVRHQTTILFPGSEIPQLFYSGSIGVGKAFIELPANWHDVVSGIWICIVADHIGLSQPANLTLSTQHIASTNSGGSYHPDNLQTWMEYVSFDVLRRSCVGIVRPDWIKTNGRILAISTESFGVKICGVRLVHKELSVVDNGITRETDVLKCFRATEYEGLTYTLWSFVTVHPTGDATFDVLSWSEKHERYRTVREMLHMCCVLLMSLPSDIYCWYASSVATDF